MLELTIVSQLPDVPVHAHKEIAMLGPDGEPQAFAWTDDRRYWIELPEIGLFRVDPPNQVFAVAYGSTERLLEEYEGRALPLALQALGREVLHASAVAFPEGIVAFCGLSEAGKSTTAYAFQEHGYPVWADDAVVLENGASGSVLACPVAFRLKLRAHARGHFAGGSAQDARAAANEPAPLAAVVLLDRSRRVDTPVDVERLTGAAALESLLPHGFRFSLSDSERKRRMMRSYLKLVSTIPILRARFPSGLEHLSSVVEKIESALRTEFAARTA